MHEAQNLISNQVHGRLDSVDHDALMAHARTWTSCGLWAAAGVRSPTAEEALEQRPARYRWPKFESPIDASGGHELFRDAGQT